MRIGISLTSSYPRADVRAAARMMTERAAAARDAGLDSLFVGDHHGMASPYFQNTPMLGRLLAEWNDNPAGCLFLLPLWNPVLVAEQIGTLASIARGRFIMQCGLGVGRDQFAAMGVEIRHRPSRFEESLTMIRRLLAGETVNVTGKRYRAEGARISPIPPEPVEVWIGGSVAASIDRAARMGDAWLAGPELTIEEARTWMAYYRERCAAYGRTPAAIAIRRDVYVGSDADDVRAVCGPIVARGYRGFDPAALVSGNAEQVGAAFVACGELGFTDVIVRHITNEQPQVLGSIERLARVRELLSPR
ncbi:MAG: LLM class flavin-dependent oxidoreductase [Dehalococcoidia bacterium]|nr:LLM class flavin-dependent oxidoreductase [Dehalococcoidia bacterium]